MMYICKLVVVAIDFLSAIHLLQNPGIFICSQTRPVRLNNRWAVTVLYCFLNLKFESESEKKKKVVSSS